MSQRARSCKRQLPQHEEDGHTASPLLPLQTRGLQPPLPRAISLVRGDTGATGSMLGPRGPDQAAVTY